MFKLLVIMLVIFNIIVSIGVTLYSVLSNTYLNEYKNIKSLRNKKLYMVNDLLLITKGIQETGSQNNMGIFVIEGEVLSNKSKIKLTIGKEEFIDWNLEYQPIYKSKLTGDYFLKDAPKEYYRGEYQSFFLGIYAKVSFFIIIVILVYLIRRKQKFIL